MKLLKIEGVEKEIVVPHCTECPFNYQGDKCILAFHLRSENIPEPDIVLDGCFPSDCPLPEYVNENEHTAPDGTELVAELSVSMDCVGCHYDVNDKCTCEEEKHFCIPSERRDKRFVRYVKKSEVK